MTRIGGTSLLGGPYAPFYMAEPTRSIAELAATLATAPWLASAPRGDRHPVLVLPGMMGTDASTLPLRRYLRHLGYPVHGWRAGRDVGVVDAVREGMSPALHRLTDRYGEPATVIGWCVGGFYARRLASDFPDQVRQVITLGTPHRMSGRRLPASLPATAVYSRTDGMVPWSACLERTGPRTENIPVVSSHLGLGHHPAALWAIADRLAQHPDDWRPFRPPTTMRALYPTSKAA